jgi:anti-sigma regulatory factor (Ser/Thr protein kinase)
VADVDLPLREHAAALARRTVRDVLQSWQAADDDDWLHEALLVTSELVGNAVRHGGRRVSLHLGLEGRHLTITVRDGSTALPVQREDDDGESGRGLRIIASLSDGWGVVDDGDGKSVWARLTVPWAPSAAPDPEASLSA